MTRTYTYILTFLVVLSAILYFALSEPPSPDNTSLPPLTQTAQGPAPIQADNYFDPARLPVTEERIASLKLPPGFQVSLFAKDLDNPSMLAVHRSGTVFVSQPNTNTVLALRKRIQNGEPQEKEVVVKDLGRIYGLAVYRDFLYMAATETLYFSAIEPDGTLRSPRVFLSPLPPGGLHPNRSLAVGPNGTLYFSINSFYNGKPHPKPEYSTVWNAAPDGKSGGIYASGLGTTLGMDWDKTTQTLWGVEQGTDWTGLDDFPLEELNQILPGRHYGWPWCNGKGQVDFMVTDPPPGQSAEAFCQTATPSAMTFTAHSGPVGFLFYTGEQFPKDYQHDGFVALHGSLYRREPVGYKVVRVRFKNGQPVEQEDFLTGFLSADGQTKFGMPCGLALDTDGALLVSDDDNGAIYRITYQPGH
jgi:glucose/arabinose dehydrogenase